MHQADLNHSAMIRRAIAEPGVPLERSLRVWMEDIFRSPLGHVRLHFDRNATLANRALGSAAFALGRHICFRADLRDCAPAAFHAILAHELAHVIQHQKAKAIPDCPEVPAALLESEADACTLAMLRGQPLPPLTPDPAAALRCWDIQGHYYTVLWASLAAGLSQRDAERNAFFVQLPDQVSELDAIAAGVTWGAEFGKSIYSSLNAKSLTALSYVSPVMYAYLKADPNVVRFWQHSSDECIDEMLVEWTVQTGLHALTGRNAEDETRAREAILQKLTPGSYEFGLALHPFGDSFAHRDLDHSTTMYPPPMGHLVERAYQIARKQWSGSAHDPDNIHKRPLLYRRYGLELYDMFRTRWGVKNPPIERQKFSDELDDIAQQPDPDLQIAEIKGYCSVALIYSADVSTIAADQFLASIYAPEKAPKHYLGQFPQTWAEFYAENHNRSNIELTPDMLKRALACAADWVGSAKPAAVLLEY